MFQDTKQFLATGSSVSTENGVLFSFTKFTRFGCSIPTAFPASRKVSIIIFALVQNGGCKIL